MEVTEQCKGEVNKKEQEFLLEEFRQCFEHMRHRDNMRMALLRFAFSFYSIFFTLIGVLLKFSKQKLTETSLINRDFSICRFLCL